MNTPLSLKYSVDSVLLTSYPGWKIKLTFYSKIGYTEYNIKYIYE